MALLPSGFGSVGGYLISRSLRFNSADSAYLNRTPAGAGNRKTWTWSGWVKRSALGTDQTLFGSWSGSNRAALKFASDNLQYYELIGGSVPIVWNSTSVFRDIAAYYHVLLSVNTSASTMTLYVNNVVRHTATTSSNYDTFFNQAIAHGIGFDNNAYFNGYLTEINFIDGQALTPSSFGQNDPSTGVWQPIKYTGTYGTNGFYVNFSDNSGTTATTLGKDYSGNGNNWTPNNFSVTAGAGNDSLVDTPTPYGSDTGAGGEVRGNYATLNPLSNTGGTYTQGNLRFTGPSAWYRSNGTLAVSTGKWYWEVTVSGAPYSPRSSTTQWQAFGFGLSTTFGSQTDPLIQTNAIVYCDNGYYKNFSGSSTDGGTAIALNDVLSIAVDLDANTFTFRLNNTQIATGTIGGTAGRELVPIIVSYANQYGVMDCNFGQRPFAYTAPSGYKALCTQNLPTPTIGATSTTQADDYFNAVLYSGNGTSQTIDTGLQPDFIWIKRRNGAAAHVLTDNVRGTSKQLFTNLTDAEQTDADSGVTAIGSSSMTLGDNNLAVGSVNGSGSTYVAWNWKANGAGSTNTDGTITSTVSANTTSGFSIVTYTGTGAAATIGHGLGVAPKMIIVKSRDQGTTGYTGNWYVYHASNTSAPETDYLLLNTTAATADDTFWNDTAPTSTVFSVGALSGTNDSSDKFVAYCFAEVAGYSKFGSYTGNGSTDGPFCYAGFQPRYLLIKCSSTTGNWVVWDSARNTYNVLGNELYPNLSNAEASATDLDITSNGFKIRNTTAAFNSNGATYIYAAFAAYPFKYSLGF